MPKGGDNSGTAWSRIVRGMEVRTPVTEWERAADGVLMRLRGEPEPDLSPIPEGVMTNITTTADLDGSRHRAHPCDGCGGPLGISVVAGPGGQIFCSDCKPGESFVSKPRGRPRKT